MTETWVCDGCMRTVRADEIEVWADYEHVLCRVCNADMEHAHARRTDPDTSWSAAESVTGLRARQHAVYQLLQARGPMTDETLVDVYQSTPGLPPQSPSGLRTRRKELTDKGLVGAVGKGKLRSGRMAYIWSLSTGHKPVRAEAGTEKRDEEGLF